VCRGPSAAELSAMPSLHNTRAPAAEEIFTLDDPSLGSSQCALLPSHTAHPIDRGPGSGSHGRWKRPCLQTAHMTI
jgi:hypothetical protein